MIIFCIVNTFLFGSIFVSFLSNFIPIFLILLIKYLLIFLPFTTVIYFLSKVNEDFIINLLILIFCYFSLTIFCCIPVIILKTYLDLILFYN
jgi:hypothetical protein